MLSITLEGPPFERGYRHGKKFAAEIREEIRTFCPERWSNAPEVAELERRLLSSLAGDSPELVVEMIGISKGAGISFDQIALLNLVLATNDLESDAIETTFKFACSAIGFRDSDVGPLVAKNCDERKSAAPFYVFQTVYPDIGFSFMGISNVGTVWLEGGMNEAGLGLMQTAGPFIPDQDGYGIACNIAPRLLLMRCRDLSECIQMLKDTYVAGWGMGMVACDAFSEVAVVEKTGDRCEINPAGKGVSFCTNHFVGLNMLDTKSIAHEGLEGNSNTRYRTLGTLFQKEIYPHTLDGVKGMLGYHGAAGFVCQHGDANIYSNYSCIAIVKEKKIHESVLELADGDWVVFLSDGVLNAGIGGVYPLGWGWEKVSRFLEEHTHRDLTAEDLADKVAEAVGGLYAGNTGDDVSIVVIKVRHKLVVTVLTGPPENKRADHETVARFLNRPGKLAVCGGTTAKIVAGHLGQPLEVDLSTMTTEVPPMARLKGVDLVCEGILTLTRTNELLRSGADRKKVMFRVDGAASLLRLLLESDHVHFQVGQAVNPAHQNPDLPHQLGIRVKVVREIAESLKAKGKEVTIEQV